MLQASHVERILATLSVPLRPPDLIAAVLEKVKCCPICTELFPTPPQLLAHLSDRHSEALSSTGSKEIVGHQVQEDDRRIFICPHCHFAVGEPGHVYATTIIIRHLEACPLNLSNRTGPARISFLVSTDPSLVDAYSRGREDILLFSCFKCSYSFGSADTLGQHLVLDHSAATAEDLTQDQRLPIEIAIHSFLDRRSKPVQLLPAVRPPSSLFQMPTPSSIGRASGPKSTFPHEQLEFTARHTSRQAHPHTSRVFSMTVRSEHIREGFVDLPMRLAACLDPTNQVYVHLTGGAEGKPILFNIPHRRLTSLSEWLRRNTIEPGDRIKFLLISIRPPTIRIWTEWEKHLNYVLRCPPEDFRWVHLPIRDCILRVMASHAGPLHYRHLYSQISRHRE
ncbi:MAG: DUF2709 domain-containing protein, partial [Planctomycetes bacterium]|nr:DUF2709 domain-containing protein [Planctomycetota bacterium]